MLKNQTSQGVTGFIKKMGQRKGWMVEIRHSQNKVPDWTLSTQEGSMLNTTPFCIMTHDVAFSFTKSGTNGKSQKHPNDACTECWAQLLLLRGLSGVCLNVSSPCEGFLQEALWSGAEHIWSSVPAAVLPFSADCLPPPCRIVCFRPTRVALLKRDASNHQDETM